MTTRTPLDPQLDAEIAAAVTAAGLDHKIESGQLIVDGHPWQIVTLSHPTLADGRPLVPELFWEVATRWRPRWKPLAQIPDPSPHLRLSGALLAAAYGAPMIATTDQPMEIFVEDKRGLRELLGPHPLGPSDPDQAGRAPAYVARCPSPAAVSADLLRGPLEVRGFATVHPVVAALDLSTDRARGHEILDGSHPQEITRVW